MQEMPAKPSIISRLKLVGLALTFVVLSVALRLVLWGALSFLDDKSIVRNTVTGVLMLGLVIAMTAFVCRRWPAMQRNDWVLLPRASLSSARLALVGLAAGGLLFTTVFALVLTTGGIHLEWRPVGLLSLSGSLLAALVATVLNAVWEEYTFRGWSFSGCAKALGAHTTAIGLGAAFGLAHLFNPQWTVAAVVSVALAGFLLGYSMLASRNILLPIGLHVGWNFTQSLLTSPRFWETTKHSNHWLSGGEWGLEGSAAGIAITALAAAVGLTTFLAANRRAARTTPVPDAGLFAAALEPVAADHVQKNAGS